MLKPAFTRNDAVTALSHSLIDIDATTPPKHPPDLRICYFLGKIRIIKPSLARWPFAHPRGVTAASRGMWRHSQREFYFDRLQPVRARWGQPAWAC